MRLTALAIPPLLPQIHADLGLSETQVGILASVPLLVFAAASVPGALLIARIGATRTLVVGLILIAAGGAARGAAEGALSLYASTLGMAAGIAVTQPALPPLVRAWFPERIGLATAVYANGLLMSEVIAVALTLPLVLPLAGGSWRGALVLWSLPIAATAVLTFRFAPEAEVIGARRRWWPDWRRPFIWRLGLLLSCVNGTYFTTNQFLPEYLSAVGRPELIGGALTSLNAWQLPASFAMLVVAGRLVRRRWVYAAMGMLGGVSVLAILFGPADFVWIPAGVIGFEGAVALTLILALPSLLGAPEDVPRLSAGMFTISYSLAVAVPILSGLLWDLTGIPALAFLPIGLAALGLATLPRASDFRG